MIETLFGTVIGGAFRLAPEIMKWMDRKDERKHEALMFSNQLEADKLKAESAKDLAQIDAGKSIDLAEIQALIEGAKAQSAQTGIRWVDGLNALVRPVLAFQWLIVLWPAVVVAGIWLAVESGVPVLQAVHESFGIDEKAMAASIASFWMLDRSIRKGGGVR